MVKANPRFAFPMSYDLRGGEVVKRMVFSVFVVLVMAASVAGTEEENSIRPIGGLSFADEYELTIVNVVVHVTDKEGNPVDDLTQADFKIFQDGQEKPITNFKLYTKDVYDEYAAIPELPSVSGESTKRPKPRPISMIIYIDNDNLHPMDRNRVLRYARDFVRDNLRPPVQMMVVSFQQKSLKILQPFTSDSIAVLDALRKVRMVSGGLPERESARRDVLDRMHTEIENQGRASSFGARGAQAYSDVLAYANEENYNLMCSIDGLREAVTFLAGAEGRKSVLYLSNGLPMIPGFDLFNAVSDSFNDPSVLTEVQRYDRSSSFKTVVSAANSHDVSFYTVGAGGLEVVGMSANEYRSGRNPVVSTLGADSFLGSLRMMAKGTGGMAIVKTNDFAEGFDRIEKDLYSYYSLGYRLVQVGSDKVHKTKVTLPGHSDLTLRYRTNWVEKSLETLVQERVLAGLLHDLDENPMGLKVETGEPSPAAGELSGIPMFLSFQIDKIALLPEGEDYVGRVVLFVAARDADGKRSDTVREEHEIRISADEYDQVRKRLFGIDTSLLMTPGVYRVAIGLMDQVTRQASYGASNFTIPSP